MQQSTNDQIQHRNPVANPDAHRIGTCAETGFWFESRAAQRQPRAAERDRMTNHRLQQAEVDRDVSISSAIESDVVAYGSFSVFHRRYKPQQRLASFLTCQALVVASFLGKSAS